MKKKNDEPIDLSEKDFSFVCPLKTEDMTAVEGGYFCGECEKKVYDVSGMSKCEYNILVSKVDNVCVTFKKVATVSLALSLAECSSPQKPKPVIAAPNSTCQTKPIEPPRKNKLAPYKAVDINKTVEIAGGIMMPKSIEKKK